MARVTGLLGWISDKASDAYDWYKEQDTPLSAYLRGDSVVDATSRSLDKFGENLSNPEYAMDWVSPLGVVGSIAKKTASKVYDPLREIDPGAIKEYGDPRAFFGKPEEWKRYAGNPRKFNVIKETIESNRMGRFDPSYAEPIENPLNYLHSKANRGDIMGGRVPKDATIQPATNTFYDDIRVNEPFPEPTREVFEFTKGSGDSKGGPVSMIKDINVPYETTRKVLPESDNLYKGAVQGRPTQPNSWTSDAVGSRKPYKDEVIYMQDKTKGISTTGITPERAEKLRRGEITLPEPRSTTADIDWVRANERPYDTTQFIRDTQGKDGDFFARLARENSQEYGGMFDNVVSSDKGGYDWFDRTAVDKYMTPHTGKFVQEIKSSPTGNYNKLKLGKSSGKSTQDLQKQVDSAVDIANNNVKYATPEDKLDAFIEAMGRIEDVNAKYVSRGKPTKVKEDSMNYLWQIHDDLQKEALNYRNTLLPQRTEQGQRMFNDNPTVKDLGTGEVDMDIFLENLARGE